MIFLEEHDIYGLKVFLHKLFISDKGKLVTFQWRKQADTSISSDQN